ncbi:hypothetical protein M405DRAFT_937493 [Rhizopogon salebrosus TDB-379]|nr:hypothetical protein M405DRAFT_937493 [Rhizopogon salebrosus TDB-379]
MSPSTEDVQRNVLIVSSFLTGLMVLDYTWNFRFEAQVMWPRIRKTVEVKIFMIARYVGLAGQIFNVWFAQRMTSGIPAHPRACMAWYLYQAVTIQCLLTLVELLLMFRAYKVYNKDKYVLAILIGLAGTQCAAMVVSTRVVVHSQSSSPTCVLVVPHPGRIYVAISTIMTNWCILAMILWRCARSAWLEPESYARVMVRDSICTVIAVTGCFISLIFMLKSLTGQNILFHLMLACFWFSAGWLVLDREKFRQAHKDDRATLSRTTMDFDESVPPDDACPAGPYDSKDVPIEVFSIAVDPESDKRLERDITDEPRCDREDRESLSSRASTILRMEMGRGEEGSEFSTKGRSSAHYGPY